MKLLKLSIRFTIALAIGSLLVIALTLSFKAGYAFFGSDIPNVRLLVNFMCDLVIAFLAAISLVLFLYERRFDA